MEFKATVISDFESYVNHFLRFGSLKPGSVMVEVDENGKPLVNEKNEVIVVDYLPNTF